MPGRDVSQEATIFIRNQHNSAPMSIPWSVATCELICNAMPWRIFRWYRGQKHYSGAYWSATEQTHVGYESRLELARLLLADFEPAVTRIVSQPFLLQVRLGSRVRNHVPDYLLLTEAGPLVVDVKPVALLDDPRVAATLQWTKKLVEDRGWGFEVWTHAEHVELANVRFLAGYRNSRWFDPALLEQLREADLDGRSVSEVRQQQWGRESTVVQAAIFHLLWCRWLTADLRRPLSGRTVLQEI